MPLKVFSNSITSQFGAIASFVCSACYFLGLYTLIYVAPDLYILPEGRLRVIDEYGCLLYLWYVIVFGIVGVCVIIVNHTIVPVFENRLNWIAFFTTLTAYLSASYLFTVCCIEILSNIFFLAEQQEIQSKRNELTVQIYSVLIGLRSYTEWTLDVWVLLVSALLLIAKRVSVYLSIYGLCVGVFGILVLHPSLQPYALYYVTAIAVWFVLIGIQLSLSRICLTADK